MRIALLIGGQPSKPLSARLTTLQNHPAGEGLPAQEADTHPPSLKVPPTRVDRLVDL